MTDFQHKQRIEKAREAFNNAVSVATADGLVVEIRPTTYSNSREQFLLPCRITRPV